MRERDVGILDAAVAPVRLEGFVLPVLKVADHGWSVVEADGQAVAILLDGDSAVPIVGIDAGIFRQGQGRRRVGGVRDVGLLQSLGSVLLTLFHDRLESGDPIGRRQVEVSIENMEENRVESAALFGVGEYYDSQILLGNQHDAGHAPSTPPVWPTILRPL